MKCLKAAAQERLQGSNFLLNRNSEGELKVESVIVQVTAAHYTPLLSAYSHL